MFCQNIVFIAVRFFLKHRALSRYRPTVVIETAQLILSQFENFFIEK